MSCSCSSCENSDAEERIGAVSNSIYELEQSCNFEFAGELGKGTYGDVLKIYDAKSNSYKAAKVLIPRNTCESEILMWSKLKHKNVVVAEEVMMLSEGVVIVIMPLQFTTMVELLSDKRFSSYPKSVDFIRRWLFESLEGLHYMHSINVCHLDLKLDNVLISHSGTAMISDFSFAYDTLSNLTENKVGIPDTYRPPELFKKLERSFCGKAIDSWCYGMMVVEAFTAECLLNKVLVPSDSWQRDIQPLLNLILYPAVFKALVADTFPNHCFQVNDLNNAMDFIDRFLRTKPDDRISCAEAISHPFVDDCDSIQTNLLEIYSSYELEGEYMFTASKKRSSLPSSNNYDRMTNLVSSQLDVNVPPETSRSESCVTKIDDISIQSKQFSLCVNGPNKPLKKNRKIIQRFLKPPQNLDNRCSSRNKNDVSVQDSRPLRFTLNKVRDDHYVKETKQEPKSGHHQENLSFTSWVRYKWKDFKKWFGWKKSPTS